MLVAARADTGLAILHWRLPPEPADPEMIENVGFDIDRMETGYMPGPKPMTFMYEGNARAN